MMNVVVVVVVETSSCREFFGQSLLEIRKLDDYSRCEKIKK
jgi:hypothetical protein